LEFATVTQETFSIKKDCPGRNLLAATVAGFERGGGGGDGCSETVSKVYSDKGFQTDQAKIHNARETAALAPLREHNKYQPHGDSYIMKQRKQGYFLCSGCLLRFK
jgi:hypothetical protein